MPGAHNRIGWLIFTVGLVWTLLYHILLAIPGLTWPPLLDFLGNLGHLVTFAGIVLVIYSLLRQHPQP